VTQAQPLEREERHCVIAALPVAELMHEDQAQTARARKPISSSGTIVLTLFSPN
jgi:hypothetical protein